MNRKERVLNAALSFLRFFDRAEDAIAGSAFAAIAGVLWTDALFLPWHSSDLAATGCVALPLFAVLGAAPFATTSSGLQISIGRA